MKKTAEIELNRILLPYVPRSSRESSLFDQVRLPFRITTGEAKLKLNEIRLLLALPFFYEEAEDDDGNASSITDAVYLPSLADVFGCSEQAIWNNLESLSCRHFIRYAYVKERETKTSHWVVINDQFHLYEDVRTRITVSYEEMQYVLAQDRIGTLRNAMAICLNGKSSGNYINLIKKMIQIAYPESYAAALTYANIQDDSLMRAPLKRRTPKIICVANPANASGKTTVSLNVAAIYAERGFRVLLVDNDPQANLTCSLGYNPAMIKGTITDIYADSGDSVKELVLDTDIPGLRLIPANHRHSALDHNKSNKCFDLVWPLRHIEDDYDYIIIDNPSSLAYTAINGLMCADYVLIPVSFFREEYVEELNQIIQRLNLQRALNYERISLLGIVLTRMRKRLKAFSELRDDLAKKYEIIGTIYNSSCIEEVSLLYRHALLGYKNKPFGLQYEELVDNMEKKLSQNRQPIKTFDRHTVDQYARHADTMIDGLLAPDSAKKL